MNVLLYGGSFDPVHNGHALVASYALEWGKSQGLWDTLWFLPSARNPLKKRDASASGPKRLEMCSLLSESIPGTKVCDFELNRPAPSYTIDTLRALREVYPHIGFRILVGADNWELFDSWREHQAILEEFGVALYPRPGYEIKQSRLPEGAVWIAGAPLSRLSSTSIRKKMAMGENVDAYVPAAVQEYLKNKKIYG